MTKNVGLTYVKDFTFPAEQGFTGSASSALVPHRTLQRLFKHRLTTLATRRMLASSSVAVGCRPTRCLTESGAAISSVLWLVMDQC